MGVLAAVLNVVFWVMQRDLLEGKLGIGIAFAIVGGVFAVFA